MMNTAACISKVWKAAFLAGMTVTAAVIPAGTVCAATYAYSAEEVMYLTGVREAAGRNEIMYTLYDLDEDGICELLISAKDGSEDTLTVFRYDEETGTALAGESLTGKEREAVLKSLPQPGDGYVWVDESQWADGSIIGVTQQTGDPGPENDFYLSSGYDWLSRTHVALAGDSSSVVEDLEEAMSRNKEMMFHDREHFQGEDIERLRDYYDMATDWERRDTEGVEPVQKYLDAVRKISSLAELTDFLTNPETDPFCTMLYLTVTLDERDTSEWVLEIDEDEFSVLPRIFHNGSKEDIDDTRVDFTMQAEHVLARSGFSQEEIEGILAGCFEVEDILLPCAWLEEEDGEETKGFLPMEEVTASWRNFPLERLLHAYGVTGGKLRVYFPAYMQTLDELYTERNLPALKSYLLAHIACKACAYLDLQAAACSMGMNEDASPEELQDAKERLNEGYFRETVSERGLLGVAEENAWMTFFVDMDVRRELTDLSQEIRNTFREMLLSKAWLSDKGKEVALEKLDNMSISVMRPDTLIDSSYLDVDTEGSFLDTYAKLSVSRMKHNLSFVGEKREKGDWRYDLRPEIASSVSNAFYYGSFNQFFILSGFVSEDTFQTDMPYEKKLAMLGEIIGHEMTHGFDPQGIGYDQNGNLVTSKEHPEGWMPEEDYRAFLERAEKIADYFDHICPLPYSTCPGSTVWGEAAADIGGLSICLAIAEKQENFDYDLFFKTYTTLWLMQSTLSREYGDLYDAHPLRHLRINVTVQQFDEFLAVYGVEPGDGMYLDPDKRIAIW